MKLSCENLPFGSKKFPLNGHRQRYLENDAPRIARISIGLFVASLYTQNLFLFFFFLFFFFPFKRTFSSYERMENGTRIEIEKSGLYVLSSYDVSLKLVRGIKLDFTLLHFEFRARDCSFNIVGGLCLICRNKSVKFGEPIYYT